MERKIEGPGSGANVPTWIAVAVSIAIGGGLVGLVASGAPQSLATAIGWEWTDDRQAQVQTLLFALGGAIAIVGLGFTASRHRLDREEGYRDAQRIALDRERIMRDRFVTLAGLLDSEAPMTRLAGVTQVAALADDWAAFGKLDEVQPCVEMLCGYLRTPWDHDDDDIERSVRRAGFEQIEQRTRTGAGVRSWSAARIDLSGARFDFDLVIEELARGGELVLSPQALGSLTVGHARGADITIAGREQESVRPFAIDVASMADGVLVIANTSDVRVHLKDVRADLSMVNVARIEVTVWDGALTSIQGRILTACRLTVPSIDLDYAALSDARDTTLDVEEYVTGVLRLTRFGGEIAIGQLRPPRLVLRHLASATSDDLVLTRGDILLVANSPDLVYDLRAIQEDRLEWDIEGAMPRRMTS